MIRIDPDLNELEVLVVAEYYKERGIDHYSLYKGNGCIWGASGSSSIPINQYFIFRDGHLVDIQID